jgi:hypothetical protein
MARRTRSEAARAGWETRREREREREEERERRSDAARRGWETRRERERESKFQSPDDFFYEPDWIIEEPIDEVGDDEY